MRIFNDNTGQRRIRAENFDQAARKYFWRMANRRFGEGGGAVSDIECHPNPAQGTAMCAATVGRSDGRMTRRSVILIADEGESAAKPKP